MLKKALAVCLCCGVLFCSCSKQDDSVIDLHKNTEQTTDFSTENPDGKVSLGFGINYPDGENCLSYDGKAVTAHLVVDSDDAEVEAGIVIFVDGIQQEYSTDENSEKLSMHKYNLSPNEKKTVTVSFVPVVKENKDELSVVFGAMLNPSFVAKDENKTYGNNHKIHTFGAQKLVMNKRADTAVQTSELYETEKMTDEFIDENIIVNSNGTTRNRLEYLNDKLVMNSDGTFVYKNEKIVFQLYGGKDNTYRVSMYINHKLVPDAFDGKAYVDVKTQSNTFSSVTVDTADIKELSDGDFIYFVAVPKNVQERELYKSSNITFAADKKTDNTQTSDTQTEIENSKGLTDVTQSYPTLSACSECGDSLFAICPEGEKSYLCKLSENGEISEKVEVSENSVNFATDEIIALSKTERFGKVSSLSVYDKNLNLLRRTEINENMEIESVCVSFDGKEIYYAVSESDNGQFLQKVYKSDFEFKNKQEIMSFSMSDVGYNNPFTITLNAPVNESEIFCTGFYMEENSPDGLPCYLIINTETKKLTPILWNEKYKAETFAGGVIIHDISIDYNLTSSGKATVYENGRVSEFSFDEPNESQHVIPSKNGKYLATFRTYYNGETAVKTTVKIYERETEKLLGTYDIDEKKYSFSRILCVAESGGYVLISAYDSNDSSYVLKIDF